MQAGLGPVDFLRQLPQIQHPAVAPPPMPGTWIGAITKMVDRWEHLHTWREQEMRLIRTAARRLQQQREQWARGLHRDVRKVIGHLHLPLLDWMVKRSSFQCTHYVDRLMQGKPCLGEITPSGVFRPERNEATMTLAAWRQAPRSRNERMLSRVCSSGAHDLDIKSWDKTLKEIQLGYCDGPGNVEELDLDTVCLTPRWPKWELKEDGSWSCRNISDWRASQGNDTVALSEKYSPEDLSTAHAVVRILRGIFPKGTHLHGSRIDWEMAFRQDPLWPGHGDCHYELVWNPHLCRVQWVRPLGGAFGNKAAQSNFVEHPHFICHFVRVRLAILLCHYSDDMWNVEPAQAAGQAHSLVLELMDLVGWRYDKKKNPPPAQSFRLLGVEHRLGVSAYVWLGKAKVEKLLRQIYSHKRSKRVTAADASTLHGSFNWARSTLWGRCGSAVLSPLRARQKARKSVWINTAMMAMFDWLENSLTRENRRMIDCDVATLPMFVTVSDGEGTGNVAVAKWEISEASSPPRITSTPVPSDLLTKWSLHSSNPIASIEGVGPLLALATWPEMKYKLWIHFIDNMDALTALIKGNSVNADLNEVMHGTWEEVQKRRLHLWVEYVNTNDNPVDRTSRGSREDLYGQGWLWDEPGQILELLGRS